MNLSLFIAKRLAFTKKNSISSTIIKIAIAAVGISVAVMIISVFMIKGFQIGISDKIFGFWGHIDILNYESSDEISIAPIRNYSEYINDITSINNITYEDEEGSELTTKGGVSHVQKYIIFPAIIKRKSEYEGLILKGIGGDFYRDKMKNYIIKGVLPSFDSDSTTKEIVISKFTAERLKMKIGDKVEANFFDKNIQQRKSLTITGIYNTGLTEYDKKLAFVDINLLREVLNWDKEDIGGFEVFIDDMSDMDIINEYIYIEILPPDIQSMTIKQKFPTIFEWLSLQNINERVILLLMLLVSIINMITSLLILILEKTNMIGILKSMGAKTWTLRRIFLYNGAYIVIGGLIIGNILGIGFSIIQKYFGIIKLDEASYYLSEAPIYFDFWSLLLINIGTLVITVLSLIVPSYLISKIDPVKAIKFK